MIEVIGFKTKSALFLLTNHFNITQFQKDLCRNKITNTPFLRPFEADYNQVTFEMIPWLQLEGRQY